MNDRRRRLHLLALVLVLTVTGSLIGTWRATAQGTAARKESEKPTSRVELRSWIIATGMSLPESKDRIHWISLVVDADQKGEGRGTLTLNPNPPGFDEYGDLLTGWETKQFDTRRATLPLIEFECRLDYVKSGAVERVNDAPITRQIYRLTGPKIKTKLSIATTGPGLTSGRLLVHDAKGRVESVIELSEIKPVDPNVPQIPCHPGCFPAGTQVRVAGRSVTIETLRVGDEVTSIDAEGHAAPRKITHIFTTKNRLLELKTDRGRLLTTRTQPVSVAGGGFRTVGELEPGDRIWHWRADQREIAVVDEVALTDREEQVFNLVIGESAVFIAGDFLVRGKPPAEKIPPPVAPPP
jgi:hypothetical protein